MPNNFLCPPRDASEENRLAFLKEAVREAENFIKTQPGISNLQLAKDAIAGIGDTKISDSLSKVKVNLEKRLIRDIVSTMSNLRPFWQYSNDNPQLDHQAEVLNKLALSWYQTTCADRQIKKWCQYAILGGGYIGPSWESDFWTRGRGDIVLKVYSPLDVLPTQVPTDGNIQKAYIVTLREAVPINLARTVFPTMAHKIVPDRQAPAGITKGLNKISNFLSPVLNRFSANRRDQQAQEAIFPTVDIYQSYIMDMSINEGSEPVLMGEPGTFWHYSVPGLNTDLPAGVDNIGRPLTRKATPEDSRIYPLRRLITWCSSAILRDDTSFWWHGRVPAVKLVFDDWPWEFLGYSATQDLHSIQESNDSLRRAMTDSANARLRPTTMHDDRTISKSLMDSLDLRVPGQSVGVDMTVSDRPVKPVLEPQYYDVPNWIPNMIASNEELMKYISGVNDFTALAKARQIPSSDTIEKILEMAGPMVTDISRNIEAALGGVGSLGEMIKCMFFQFYTAPRRLQVLGKNGLTEQDVDYHPGNLIPSHNPDEDPKNGPSRYSQIERARMYMDSFYFKMTPNSIHQITQMSRKLLYIQIQKAGVPIDPWTMAEVMDIPNFGHPPEGTNTVFERWVAWERLKGDLTARIQAQTQQILQAEQMQMMIKQALLQSGIPAGAEPPPSPPGPPPQGGLPQPSFSPALGQNPPGRPPEFTGTPRIVQKDSGTRSTITGS